MSTTKTSCKRKNVVVCEELDIEEKKLKENGAPDINKNITEDEEKLKSDITHINGECENVFFQNSASDENGANLNSKEPICDNEVLKKAVKLGFNVDKKKIIERLNSNGNELELLSEVKEFQSSDDRVNGPQEGPILIDYSQDVSKELNKDLDKTHSKSKESDSESSLEQSESDEDAIISGQLESKILKDNFNNKRANLRNSDLKNSMFESKELKNDLDKAQSKSKESDSESSMEQSESDEDAIISGQLESKDNFNNKRGNLRDSDFAKKYASDDDSIIDVVSITPDRDVCFVCKSNNGELIQCSIESSCDRKYHKNCVDKFPTKLNACPLHFCFPCYIKTPKTAQISKDSLYRCSSCPTAFHNNGDCFIPGSMILSENSVVCPKHFDPERERKYLPVRNLNFCVHCGCNEDVAACISCPFAAHKKCHCGTFVGDVCVRCKSHSIYQYGDIVWVKVYDFRWWPAKIIDPEDVPLTVQKAIHFNGEFPVQLFLNKEYYWVNTGRVYPFVYNRIGVEDHAKHNFKRFIADANFEEAVELGLAALKEQMLLQQSSESINTKKPPPYKFIKSNRPVGNVQIYTFYDTDNTCGCKSTDKNPCGYDTICLNRNMLQECHDGICESGAECQNRKFVKVQNAPCKPFFTQVRGWGLKATGDIKKGEFVIEYVGDLIDEEECERRIKQKQLIGDTNFYFCTLDSNRIIDAGPKGNFSRFMNHSCDPNCETQKWIVNGDPRVGLFAKKDIKSGTELTFDYQMDFSHYEKLKCNCGSSRCSGLIGKKPQNGHRTSETRAASPEQDKESFQDIPQKSSKSKEAKKSKEKVKINNVTPNFVTRINGVKTICFKCKTGGKLIKCSLSKCDKYFHLRCLKDGDKITLESWKCPCHFCKNCENESKYECGECPNAYCSSHVDKKPKSNIKKFLCSKHR